jgi:hypothetical protein
MDILRKFVVLKPFSAHPSSSTLGPQQTHLESFAMCHTWSCLFARKQQVTVNCILLFFQDISEFDSSKCMYPFPNPSNSSEVPAGTGITTFFLYVFQLCRCRARVCLIARALSHCSFACGTGIIVRRTSGYSQE